MKLSLLKADIVSNNIPKFLIFNVSEPVLCKQYIDSMSNALGKYFKYYSSADEVFYETTSNFKEDFIYIIFEDIAILKNTNYVTELINTNRNIILYYNNLDRGSDFYKQFSNYIVDFDTLDKYTTIAYLHKQLENADNQITLAQDKIEQLVEFCECNFSKSCLEFDKVITLGQKNSDLLIDYMLNKGFSDYRKTNVFSFIQKILNKDQSVFDDLQRLDESVVGVLTLLHKQARIRLLNTGNNVYANIMQLCSELDSGIKDGSVETDIVLDYLLLKVM